jgi:hypothetical protein
MMANRMARARFFMTVWAATSLPVTAFPLFVRSFVARAGDRCDQRVDGRLVHDLGPTSPEIDRDGRNAGYLTKCRVYVFDAAIARHAGDPQGGDHVATVA